MLAFMPMDTMSLAVLPPSSSHAQVSRPATHAQRPKLSLNTASLPSTFGKSSTGLRLDTPSIASPTTRNTFSNAYGRQHVASSPQSVTLQEAPRPPKSRLSLDTSVPSTHQHPARSPSADSVLSATSASTESSISSASTADSYNRPIPYRLPFNHNSILSNGPHGCARRRKPTALFPAPKKVSFRAPLTEDIRNERYTTAHSDIEPFSSSSSSSIPSSSSTSFSSSSSSSSPFPSSSSSSSSTTTLDLPPSAKGQHIKNKRHDRPEQRTLALREPACGDKRDSSSDDDSDSDICPSTPITRHSKRPREWVWTLGPLNTTTLPSQAASPADVDMSSPAVESTQ